MKFELNWPSGFSENVDRQRKTDAFSDNLCHAEFFID